MRSIAFLSALALAGEAAADHHRHDPRAAAHRARATKAKTSEDDPAQYVDQFIGTINGGHVFAGATLPWGSVKAVADANSSDNQAGFVSDGSGIRGISQLHDDGTGGGASLGNFKLFPTYCSLAKTAGTSNKGGVCVTDEDERTTHYVSGSPTGSPGYFGLELESGIGAEVSVTEHAALHRFTFSHHNKNPAFLVDLTDDLMHTYINGSIHIKKSKKLDGVRVTGSGRFTPSFGVGTYDVHFCLDAAKVTDAGLYENDTLSLTTSSLSPTGSSTQAGALFQLDKDVLAAQNYTYLARIGISWTSPEKACKYAEAEIPGYPELASFDAVKQAARDRWNEVLGTTVVGLNGVTEDQTVMFWSSLYRTYISPINVSGDNPLFESPYYYDSYYCIWDSFRVVHPLFALTHPDVQSEMIQSVLSIYEYEGWLPDCRMSLDKGFTQGGSNADNLLADSYVKGIKADWNLAYKAMVKDATVEPVDWGLEGRGGIRSRAKLGYVPVNDTTDVVSDSSTMGRSASRTLEYSFNDFGIATVAFGLGKKIDTELYAAKSYDYLNLWDFGLEAEGYTGFIQPRYKNGSFMYVDPRRCSVPLCHTCCYLNDAGGEFYEASSWEYSFFVPHDMATLVKLMGGPETFVKRLDKAWNSIYIDIGDEPAFLTAYQYNYGGRPDKSVDRQLVTLREYYNTTTGGIPGNDDSGAMGAWVAWASFGFYPVAGEDVYLLSTPLFPSVSFATPAGGTFDITTKGFDGATTNKYIQSITLNGKPYTKNWLKHEVFLQPGTMHIVLGPKLSKWGTQPEDLPPSLSTGGFFDGISLKEPNLSRFNSTSSSSKMARAFGVVEEPKGRWDV